MKLSRFEVLTAQEVEMIHEASLDVLENCGVKIMSAAKRMLSSLFFISCLSFL